MVWGYVNRGFNPLFLTFFFWFDTCTIVGNSRQTHAILCWIHDNRQIYVYNVFLLILPFFLEGLFAVCTCTSFTSMLTRFGTFWMLSQLVSMQTNNFCRFLTLLHSNQNDLNSIFNGNIFSLFHIRTHMRENITVLSFEKTIKISMQVLLTLSTFFKNTRTESIVLSLSSI